MCSWSLPGGGSGIRCQWRPSRAKLTWSHHLPCFPWQPTRSPHCMQRSGWLWWQALLEVVSGVSCLMPPFPCSVSQGVGGMDTGGPATVSTPSPLQPAHGPWPPPSITCGARHTEPVLSATPRASGDETGVPPFSPAPQRWHSLQCQKKPPPSVTAQHNKHIPTEILTKYEPSIMCLQATHLNSKQRNFLTRYIVFGKRQGWRCSFPRRNSYNSPEVCCMLELNLQTTLQAAAVRGIIFNKLRTVCSIYLWSQSPCYWV